GPDPDSPVTASSNGSGTRTTVPTAERIDSAHARSSSPASRPGAMAAAPAPTSAGVFGMARTTAMPDPNPASSVASGTPAAIDSARWQPASAAARHAPGTSPGLTAITTPSPAQGSASTSTPGNSS